MEVVQASIRKKGRQVTTRTRPINCIALLDFDRLDSDKRLGRNALAEAERHAVHAILVHPNLEGLLLRLHANQQTRNVPASIALGQLRKLWPEYRKPAGAMELESRFTLDDLKRVAQNDNQISRLLNLIGLG